MGFWGKAGFGLLGLVVIGGIAKQFPNTPAGPPPVSPEDRCEDRIGSRLPHGAFIVFHTEAHGGRSLWVIDHMLRALA